MTLFPDTEREKQRREGGDGWIYRYRFRNDVWDKMRKYRISSEQHSSSQRESTEMDRDYSEIAQKLKMKELGRKFKAWNHGHIVCESKTFSSDGLWVFGNDGVCARFDLDKVSQRRHDSKMTD